MEQIIYEALKYQHSPDGKRFWTFNPTDQQFRFHDSASGTETVYNALAFELFCMDLVESITSSRPNQISPEVIEGLKLKFRTIQFRAC